jgi:hypothetical protein
MQCVNRNGKPRMCIENQEEAKYMAERTYAAYGEVMIPYLCDRCRYWHLCPEKRHTPSRPCLVCDKQAYTTQAAAQRRADIQREEQGLYLRVYQCPSGLGWHLTRRKQ